MSETAYKVLLPDGTGKYSGKPWSLPTEDKPGDWMEVSGPLVMCENGLHITDWQGVWQYWIHAKGVVYEAEYDGESIGSFDDGNRKIAARRARLVRRLTDNDLPAWWLDAMQFVATIPSIPWMQNDGAPNPEWRMSSTIRAASRAAARDASGAAARDASGAAARDASRAASGAAARAAALAAAWDVARAASWDAALLAQMLVCGGLDIDQRHRDHARARWDVWQKGYGLFCDVDGVLYVYEALT